jgi:prepilin-type N-terminal cleavage/methylation domain-containing protein
MRHTPLPSDPISGFTLLEVLFAMSILVIVALGIAALFLRAISATADARRETMAVALATERLEQLRALAWGLGDAASPGPVSDVVTDLSRVPAASGGAGLSPSPSSTLTTNTPGYVDFADRQGLWISAAGTTPPPDALFVRRWSISTNAAWPDALVLQVSVTSVRPALPSAAWLVTVKGRKGR